MTRALVLLSLSLLLAPPIGASETATAEAVWKVTPLLSVGDRMPDDPSLVVQGLGEWFWCPPDMLVAWVRIAAADAPNAWLLASIRPGAVKSIIREGEGSRSKYGAPGVPPLDVIYSMTWKGNTGVIAAPGRAFLVRGSLQAWDGESLRLVAMKDQEVIVGERSYTLQGLQAPQILGSDDSGAVAMMLPVSKPQKGRLIVTYDGETFAPLFSTLGSFPGMASVGMNFSFRNLPVFWPAPGGVFVNTPVTGAPYDSGLFWVEPGRTELIAVQGDRKQGPLSPAQATLRATIVSAGSTRDFQVLRAEGRKGGWSFLRTPRGQSALRPPGNQPGALRQYPGIFLTEASRDYFYMSSRATAANYAEIRPKKEQTVFDTFWRVAPDGAHREVAMDQPRFEVKLAGQRADGWRKFAATTTAVDEEFVAAGLQPRYREFRQGVPGLLVWRTVENIELLGGVTTRVEWDRIILERKIDEGSAALVESFLAIQEAGGPDFLARFLPAGSDVMVAVPTLATDRGPVSLRSVLGFSSDDQAMAVMGDSIVALTRAGASP